MAFLFRWLMRAFLAAGRAGRRPAPALAYYLAGQSLPDYDRDLTLEGPEQEIEIVRDRYAVPHILSKTDRDAFFGLGFVHAQDRLWQMTLLRRTVQGRLSEIFGPETLGIDKLMRALDLYGLARAGGAAADRRRPGGARGLCRRGERLAAGWCSSEALGRGAPEFFLFTPDIAPWTPADSIAVQKLMALQMTDKAAMETLRGAAVAGAAAGAAARHPAGFAQRAGDGAAAVLRAVPGRAPGGRWSRRRGNPLDPLPRPGLAGASNAFAAMGRRTAGGRAAAGHRPAPGAERAVDLDAGADGPRRGAGDGRRRSRASRR